MSIALVYVKTTWRAQQSCYCVNILTCSKVVIFTFTSEDLIQLVFSQILWSFILTFHKVTDF